MRTKHGQGTSFQPVPWPSTSVTKSSGQEPCLETQPTGQGKENAMEIRTMKREKKTDGNAPIPVFTQDKTKLPCENSSKKKQTRFCKPRNPPSQCEREKKTICHPYKTHHICTHPLVNFLHLEKQILVRKKWTFFFGSTEATWPS